MGRAEVSGAVAIAPLEAGVQRTAAARLPAGKVPYRALDYTGRSVLLFGGERLGLTDEQLRACDTVARIPMSGALDSLNLAAAIVMYEAAEQHADAERRE